MVLLVVDERLREGEVEWIVERRELVATFDCSLLPTEDLLVVVLERDFLEFIVPLFRELCPDCMVVREF